MGEQFKNLESHSESIYGPDIKETVKKHDISLQQGKIYHLSASEDLNILVPSMPAEEIKDGKIVWEMDERFPDESKAACFGINVEKILEHNPIKKGFIYAPKSKDTKGFRRFYAEAIETEEWLDSVVVGEVRAYKPVEVIKVGEFEMIATKQGLKPKLKWYKRR